MGGACSTYGVRIGEERDLVGKSEGKTQLGRPRCGWEYNNKVDVQETGCGGVEWIDLAQDRNRCWALVNAQMNFRVPLNAGDFLTS